MINDPNTSETKLNVCPIHTALTNVWAPVKLAKTSIWHSGRTDNFIVHHGKEVMEKIPENIYAIIGNGVSSLCFKAVQKLHQIPGHKYYEP